MKKRAFSLIELMIAISVLSIGIVLIARSFLSASNALTNGQNRIAAINFLETRMGEIEEEALKGSDKLMKTGGSTVIDSRTFTYSANLDEIKLGEEADKKVVISSIALIAEWTEGSRRYDEIVATYFNLGKKE